MTVHRLLVAAWIALPLRAQAPAAEFDPIKRVVTQFDDEIRGRLKPVGAFAAPPSDTILEDTLSLKTVSLWARLGVAIVAADQKQAKADLQKYAESFSARTDSQTTSTGENSGSTSLALKGGVAQVLSLAVENGSLKRETSGSTVTFRAKPLALVKALGGQDFFQIGAAVANDKAAEFWNRFSFAASFDTNRGGVQNTLLANSKQLVSWSVRGELVNRRSENHAIYSSKWRAAADKNAKEMLATDQAMVDALSQSKSFETWHKNLIAEAQKADLDWKKSRAKPEANEENVADSAIKAFSKLLETKIRELELELNKLEGPAIASVKAWQANRKEIQGIEKLAQRGMLATLDFTVQRDDALPDLYATTFVFENSPFEGKMHDFTVNVSGSFYRVEPRAPSTANRFKSFDAVAQYDIPLGEISTFGKAILSFAGKFQYVGASVIRADAAAGLTSGGGGTMTSMSTTPAPALPNLRALIPTVEGPLAVFQAKISFPVKGASARIPLAFTAATRSEAFQRPDYRAQVGVVFDLDTMFAKASAAK